MVDMKKEDNFKNKQVKFPYQDPTKGGRPRKLVGNVISEMQKNGITKVSKTEIEDLYLSLINTTKSELEVMQNDETQPMLVRIVIKNILADKGFEIIEKMLDRAVGKPTQTNINENIETKPIEIVFKNYDDKQEV